MSHGIKLTQMKKEDLANLLRGLGEEPHPKWTVPGIQSRIRELTNALEKEENPLKGMTSMNKETLLKLAGELKVILNPSDTKGTIMRKLGLQVEMNTVPKPTDLVGFGRHANLEYVTLATEVPSYFDWAIKTHQDGSQEPRLNRLARWGLEWKKDKDKATPRVARAKSDPRKLLSKRRATIAPEEFDMTSDTTNEEMMDTIKKLTNRLEELEKASKSTDATKDDKVKEPATAK